MLIHKIEWKEEEGHVKYQESCTSIKISSDIFRKGVTHIQEY